MRNLSIVLALLLPAGAALAASHSASSTAVQAVGCDDDGDGHPKIACGGDDCDDTNASRHPGAAEVCDAANVDEDCNPSTFGTRDTDGDGYTDAQCCNLVNGQQRCGTDCDDRRGHVHPHQAEVCNGLDDNCDGAVDDGVMMTVFRDKDGDLFGAKKGKRQICPHAQGPGWVTNNGDCDDTSVKKNPILGCGEHPRRRSK